MGLLGNIFKGGKELSYAANAIANVIVLLDKYEIDNDFLNYLCVSAWITQVGFLDLMERNTWLPNYTLYVPINGHQTRMTMMEAMMRTYGRILSKAKQLSYENQKFIDDIFDKKEAFYNMEEQMPLEIINMFKK